MAMSSALEEIVSALRSNPYSPSKTLEELRNDGSRKSAKIIEDVEFSTVNVEGVNAEWVNASGADPNNVFFFLHGGGYYRGSAAESRATTARISKNTGAYCLSVNYRLAPENPFPAALEDVYTAYKWLLGEGINPQRIVVGGISAGGGLVMALLLKIKEASNPLPAGAVPISAWVDLLQTGASIITKADLDPMISGEYLNRMADQYLQGVDPTMPLASPLYGDLSGLPRLLIQVGSMETLLDDSVRLAERAEASGVTTKLEIWQNMFHGWHNHAHQLDEARKAIENIGSFYRETLEISTGI